ncbi:MAG: CRISPR-associated helicase Cas3' [Oscillospiraceae bacterium]|nr:CRISPR-associated helicase Cas3' [Oscillospiraceae bacterium]
MYLGHRSEDGRLQPLEEHLRAVSALTGAFARAFGAEELGRLLGLCHDLGKYSDAAQRRMRGEGPKVDHATAGGQELSAMFPGAPYLAYPVLGHHGGLPNGGSRHDTGDAGTLFGRLKKAPLPDYAAFREEIALFRPAEPEFAPQYEYGFSISFWVRMLFSCLVDADFLDTERFMSAGQVTRGGQETMEALRAKLMERLEPMLAQPKGAINEKRTEILRACLRQAEGAPGLYSLTVPTGGGKTLSSLAFALTHAVKHGKRRVIYVIPYTSIIEQNGAVFSRILGEENVLLHYANAEYNNAENGEKTHYLAAENWDMPVVVTTNVQFFESLFAAKTSRCRKLHNIAESVIIFDEAQMLPTPYLLPCTRAIAELVHQYRATAVLCSATQPALDGFFPSYMPKREICPDTAALYDFFRRTSILYLGPLSEDALAERLGAQEQVLCIVNTRKQAQALYHRLTGEGNYHLSTSLYPAHRRRMLSAVRARLAAGQVCRLISTSLVEAGVDMDFPQVYRARAGLDSIVQAAGRCNREGKRAKEESMVYVFDERGDYSLPLSQRLTAEVFDLVAQKYDDLGAPDAIQAYFQHLYRFKGEALDEKQIVGTLEAGAKQGGSFPFADIADAFQLIESATHPILIPLEEGAELASRLRKGERSRALFRRAGDYTVSVYDDVYRALLELGALEVLDEELSVLADLSQYSEITGLNVKPGGGNAIIL